MDTIRAENSDRSADCAGQTCAGKSNDITAKIHPTKPLDVDARLAAEKAKIEAKASGRRSQGQSRGCCSGSATEPATPAQTSPPNDRGFPQRIVFDDLGRVMDHPDPKAGFLAVFPVAVQRLFPWCLSITPIMLVFPGLFALTTWLNARALPHPKSLGPNRSARTVCFNRRDGLKMVTKEDIVPRNATN